LKGFWRYFWLCLCSNCSYIFLLYQEREVADTEEADTAMLKDASGKVLSRAPRKALAVKNTCKKDAGKKDAGKKDAGKKHAGTAKPQKKHAKAAGPVEMQASLSPRALQTRVMNIQSILRSTSPTPPSSPTYPPSSLEYKPEGWRLSFATLSARIDKEHAELRALKDLVQQMEKAAAEGGRSAEGGRLAGLPKASVVPAPTSLFGE